ncbi:unnamed protein product [Calypogeia fissa]
MTTIYISTVLPKSVIQSLKDNGTTVRDPDCKYVVLELLEQQTIDTFTQFLATQEHEDVDDPLLNPHFGNPINPFVSPQMQLEIFQLLACYQPLIAADFVPGAPLPAPRPPVVPLGGSFQYRHAVHMVMQQIENTDLVFGLNGLNAVPSANVICEMNIVYANCTIAAKQAGAASQVTRSRDGREGQADRAHKTPTIGGDKR